MKNSIVIFHFVILASIAFAGSSEKSEQQDSIRVDDYIYECLHSDAVSDVAKKLMRGETVQDLDSLESLVDSFLNGKKSSRLFYLLAFTNTFEHADGAYAELVGYTCASFVESSPVEFFTYFTYKPALKVTVLQKWADMSCGEIALVAENENPDEYPRFVGAVSSQMEGASPELKRPFELFKMYLNETCGK